MPPLGPTAAVTIELVEGAVEQMITLMRGQLNNNINLIYLEAMNVDNQLTEPNINLPEVNLDQYIVSEAFYPLSFPSVFVIPDRTRHDLEAQNFVAQTHDILVALVAEDTEAQRLQRKMWRYSKALFLTLHDQAAGNIKILVREIEYGPTLEAQAVRELAAERAFRKDVTLRCEVEHYEGFPLTR